MRGCMVSNVGGFFLSFRECVESLKERYFPELNNMRQRAEFFPVEWRSSLKLDGSS